MNPYLAYKMLKLAAAATPGLRALTRTLRTSPKHLIPENLRGGGSQIYTLPTLYNNWLHTFLQGPLDHRFSKKEKNLMKELLDAAFVQSPTSHNGARSLLEEVARHPAINDPIIADYAKPLGRLARTLPSEGAKHNRYWLGDLFKQLKQEANVVSNKAVNSQVGLGKVTYKDFNNIYEPMMETLRNRDQLARWLEDLIVEKPDVAQNMLKRIKSYY